MPVSTPASAVIASFVEYVEAGQAIFLFRFARWILDSKKLLSR